MNIATQSEITIGELAQMLITKINPEAQIVSDDVRLRPAKSEVERLFGSNEKIKAITNWQQRYSFSQALDETIAWFSQPENLARYKADIYNV